MVKISEWCVEAIKISKRIQKNVGSNLSDFVAAIHDDDEVKKVSLEIRLFARQYSMPGI